jgi:4-hydroxybenzoate polyprenyltransferase
VSRIRTTARLVVLLCRPPVLLLLGMFALLGMAQAGSHGDWWTTARLLLAVAGFLVASVAVNDLADEAVDRVNLAGERSRPLVAGGATRSDLPLVAVVAAITSLAAAGTFGGDVLAVVAAGMALSAAYSLPPLRLSARGAIASLLLPAGYVTVPFLAGLWTARPEASLRTSDRVLLLGLYLGFIGRILLKDFRDVRGDAQFGKRTFLVRYGRVWTCRCSAVLWVAGSLAVAGVRDAGPTLWVAQAAWVAIVVALLRALSLDGGARRAERLISAVAIVGRGMVLTTIVHLGLVDRHTPAALATAVVVSLVVLILGQAWTMVRYGPSTRVRVPAAWSAAEQGQELGAVAVEAGAGPALAAVGDERVLAPRDVRVAVDRGAEGRSALDGRQGLAAVPLVGGDVGQ